MTISYKTQFIDKTTSLSNLVDNLTERIYKESFKGNSMKNKCSPFNKNYSVKIDEKLKKRFKNTFRFSNNDINKFILLPRKGVYSYEYMNDLEKFNETSLLVKEIFYSNLNMEDIRGHPQKKSDKNINQDMLLLEVEI